MDYFRIQMYIGEEQDIYKNDTLNIRCFDRNNLTKAFTEAGFMVQSITPLQLPFEASVKEKGIFANIIGLIKSTQTFININFDYERVTNLLSDKKELDNHTDDSSEELESWMSINYAKTLINKGEAEKAKTALDYAYTLSNCNTIDTKDILNRIENLIDSRDKNKKSLYQKNLDSLKNNILINRLNECNINSDLKIERINSTEGSVILYDGQCLDHRDKPVTSARIWASKQLNEDRIKQAKNLIIFGFGSGYHVKELVEKFKGKITVIEPSLEVFKSALEANDFGDTLCSIHNFIIGNIEELELIQEEHEILIRPQTQSVFPEWYVKTTSFINGKKGLATLKPGIGIIGPLQGGTLPILSYTTKSLLSFGQRAKGLDLSAFNQGFSNIDSFVKDKSRLTNLQNHYADFVSSVVLDYANENPCDIAICMAQVPLTPRALIELKNKGIITVLWFVEDYLRFTYWKDFAKYYDFIFTIQKDDCISKLKEAGCPEVHYLPVAADADIHRPLTLSLDERSRWGSKISFVGAGYYNRQQMFASLAGMPMKIWGTEWPLCKPFDRMLQEGGRRLSPDEYIKIFNSTEININLHSSTERDGVDPSGDFINPRTFELAAAGAFQLVDERSLLPECFKVNEEIITFRNLQDLKDKINYYLENPVERFKIIEKARERVLKDHTYNHRINKMMSIIYGTCFDRLKLKESSLPWKKLIERASKDSELEKRCIDAYQRGEEPKLDALVYDIANGKGKLTETEQKLLFLFHVRKQIIMMKFEESGNRG